jgi:hypothetical protein
MCKFRLGYNGLVCLGIIVETDQIMHNNISFIGNILANFLTTLQELHLNDYLLSNNKCFKAQIDKYGNFSVLQLSTGKTIWSTNTAG